MSDSLPLPGQPSPPTTPSTCPFWATVASLGAALPVTCQNAVYVALPRALSTSRPPTPSSPSSRSSGPGVSLIHLDKHPERVLLISRLNKVGRREERWQ